MDCAVVGGAELPSAVALDAKGAVRCPTPNKPARFERRTTARAPCRLNAGVQPQVAKTGPTDAAATARLVDELPVGRAQTYHALIILL